MCACVVHLYRFKLPTEAGWGIPCDETRGDSVGGNKIDQIVVAVQLHHLFKLPHGSRRTEAGRGSTSWGNKIDQIVVTVSLRECKRTSTTVYLSVLINFPF